MAKQKNEDVFTEIDEIACTYYLIKQNKTEAYILYRRISNMPTISESTVRGQASMYFKQEKIQRYINFEEEKLRSRYGNGEAQLSYREKNTSIDANYSDYTDEEIREIALETLFFVKDSPDSSSSDKITAVKNITDIMNAKKIEKPLSESEKLIHYILPADICEKCERKSEIYAEHGYPATEEEIKEAFYSNKITKKEEDDEK
mgnify:CR=1 FL=1